MGKTNDTSYDVAATSERELTKAELSSSLEEPSDHYEFYAVGRRMRFGDPAQGLLLSGLYSTECVRADPKVLSKENCDDW